MSDIDYRLLAKEILAETAGTRTKAVSSTPTSIYGHGPAGLFSTPGLSRPLFSAMLLPRQGLLSALPIRESVDTNPLYGIITGVAATSGSNPTGVCDDPPTAGVMSLCTHSFVFGRNSRQTRVFDVDRAGKLTNRGEFRDFQVFGNPMDNGLGGAAGIPSMPGMAGVQNAAVTEVAKALFELGVAWSRDFARQIYTGNPANNTSGGGYMEFYGLDKLINTGYRDAITGVTCPAADSIIRTFNKEVKANAVELIRQITNLYRNLKWLAARSGLDPVKWSIAMTFGLFYEITEIWPSAYYTFRNTVSVSGNTYFVNSSDIEKLRDDMRGDLMEYNGQYLLIDGQKVEVVLDDSITETENANGTFTSDMYFVPMTVLGSQPVTYMEYFNYDTPGGAMEMARTFAPGDTYYTTDNGRFMWHKKPPTNFCVQLLAKTEPRLLFLTPYLAARLTSCIYSPIDHERSAFTASKYFVAGGRTDSGVGGPSYFSPVP